MIERPNWWQRLRAKYWSENYNTFMSLPNKEERDILMESIDQKVNMTNHQKILALNTIWYDMIGGEHHKDRDCHFRICTHYMYGDSVEWEVEHHGYILHDKEAEFITLEKAEHYLINDILKKGILDEVDTYLEHYGDPDWDQHHRYAKDDLEEVKKAVLEIAP